LAKQRESGRQHSHLPSVSRSLQVAAVTVTLLIVAATTQQLAHIRDSTLANTERQMSRLDMAFAEQTGRAAETVDFSLRNAIDAVRQLPPGTKPHAAVMDDLLHHWIEGVQQVRGICVTDQGGTIIFASGPPMQGDVPGALHTALVYHATHPDAGLRIGDPLRETDGMWTALMTRRINAPDGSFAGIASARLDLRYFEDFYRAVDLHAGGTIVLHLRDGTVLARYPHNEKAIGTSDADMPPFKDILAHEAAGTVIVSSPLDGRERVLAIRALDGFPLAVNVSVDERQVLAPWRREAWFFGLGALVICGLVVTLLLQIAHRSRQVERLVVEFRNAKDAAELANLRLVEQMEERERAEAALRQAQRIEAVGRLTGGVAHDFNNLLTVVRGNIELLSRSARLADPPERDLLAAMRAAADRGATLTGQLLAFARRQPLVPRAVDLNAVIAGMQDLLRSALGSTIQVETRPAADLWPAMVDATQIELVVLNLTINARDAMPRGGVLYIETANAAVGPPQGRGEPAEGAYVSITVRDSGTGMTAEVRARAFEPFFTTKAPGSGSGLGLSQVYGTARQSGGGVRIDSTPGDGTSVTIYLPRASTMAGPPPVSRIPSGAGRGNVLMVDDDPLVRETTAAVLRDFGYEVREASGGVQALDLLRRDDRIEVLLTDVVMPGMNGAELVRLALDVRPGLAVLFMSGYAAPEEITGALRRHRLVRKPFLPADLATQIEAALAEAHAVAE
jgi:signal transduction histidine kinase/ActR/RegA family two-component response regulator